MQMFCKLYIKFWNFSVYTLKIMHILNIHSRKKYNADNNLNVMVVARIFLGVPLVPLLATAMNIFSEESNTHTGKPKAK